MNNEFIFTEMFFFCKRKLIRQTREKNVKVEDFHPICIRTDKFYTYRFFKRHRVTDRFFFSNKKKTQKNFSCFVFLFLFSFFCVFCLLFCYIVVWHVFFWIFNSNCGLSLESLLLLLNACSFSSSSTNFFCFCFLIWWWWIGGGLTNTEN